MSQGKKGMAVDSMMRAGLLISWSPESGETGPGIRAGLKHSLSFREALPSKTGP